MRVIPRPGWIVLELDSANVNSAIRISNGHGDVGAALATAFGLPEIAATALAAVSRARSDMMRKADKGQGIWLTWTYFHLTVGFPASLAYPLIASRGAAPAIPRPEISDSAVRAATLSASLSLLL